VTNFSHVIGHLLRTLRSLRKNLALRALRVLRVLRCVHNAGNCALKLIFSDSDDW